MTPDLSKMDVASMRFGMKLARDRIQEICFKLAQASSEATVQHAFTFLGNELEDFPLVGGRDQ